MKRGLKVSFFMSMKCLKPGYNRYPDEKGTERSVTSSREQMNKSYNRYPDEKGTESFRDKGFGHLEQVTTVTPMKRGLKGDQYNLLGCGS